MESLSASARRTVVVAGGLHVHVREWGEPGTPAVLFWHGLGKTGADLDSAAPVLVEECGVRVIALDAPGVGDSQAAAVPEGYRSDASAAQAAGVLDSLGLDRAVFLGHSWGATVGCYLAATHAERLAALVLLDGGYLDLADLPGGGRPPPTRLEHTTPAVWAAIVDAGFRQPPSAVLAEIPGELPVLLVAATEPAEMAALREERLDRFRAAVRQAEIESMPGVSHNMLADAGPAVAEIVAGWLSRRGLAK